MRQLHISILLLILGLHSCKEEKKISLALEESPNKVALFGEGIVSSHLYERDIAISPDGREIIYTLGDFKQSKRCLVSLKKEKGTWASPQILPFSGEHQDIEPFFTQAGNRLFFASNRPINDSSKAKDYNIWYSDRQADTWSEPMALSEKINTQGDEFYPSLGKSGNLYFTATRKDGIGREDIFVSVLRDGKYQTPLALDTLVNTKYYEFNAYISPEEDLIIFSSFGRKDDLGGGDLYYSKKDAAGKWMEAKNMGSQVNSDKLDYCPFVDIERKNFYFTSERMADSTSKLANVQDLIKYAENPQNGMGDIYRIGLDQLNLK